MLVTATIAMAVAAGFVQVYAAVIFRLRELSQAMACVGGAM